MAEEPVSSLSQRLATQFPAIVSSNAQREDEINKKVKCLEQLMQAKLGDLRKAEEQLQKGAIAIKDAQGRETQLTEELQKCKNDLNDLKEDTNTRLCSLQSQVSTLEAQVKKTSVELQATKEEAATRRKELDLQVEENRKSEERNKQLESEKAQIEQELLDKKQELDELSKAKQCSDDRIKILEGQLHDKRKESERLQASLQNTNIQNKQASNRHTEDIRKLQEELQQMRAIVESLKEKNKELEKTVTELEHQDQYRLGQLAVEKNMLEWLRDSIEKDLKKPIQTNVAEKVKRLQEELNRTTAELQKVKLNYEVLLREQDGLIESAVRVRLRLRENRYSGS